MASQKRMVDLNELIRLLNDGKFDIGLVGHVRYIGETIAVKVPSDSDASTSSPEHRTPVIDSFNASFNAAEARFKKLGNDIAELQAKVRALASPVKLYVTPVGTDQFGAPKCDAFFQAPDPPKPTPPPCPEGYEHLDPPEFRMPLVGERFMAQSPCAHVQEPLERFPTTDYKPWEPRWIVRPKAAPAAEPKQEWKVGDVAEFDLSEDGKRSIKAPIYRLANGIASFYVLGIATQALVVALRRPGGAK